MRIRVLSSRRFGSRATANLTLREVWVGVVLDGEDFPQFVRATDLEEIDVDATTLNGHLGQKIAEYQARGDVAKVEALTEVRDSMLLGDSAGGGGAGR